MRIKQKIPSVRPYLRQWQASVSGVPGRVDINVCYVYGEQSTFSFVMSDAEQASTLSVYHSA
ncbi:hypothetical protein [Duncaniella muris]|uniref:hypothetical protein n=1 Tax=Duncaniella muris TaxID=2094150 RepID=UPI003F681222